LHRWAYVVIAGVLAVSATSASAITPTQLDDFEIGTTQGWATGGSGAPNNVATGGPAGLNDAYMQMNSTGSGGAGGRLIVFNSAQWSGDYTAAGVTGISMNFRNPTATPLPMRIAVKSSAGNTPGYASTNPFTVPADGAWHTAVFSLDPGALTAVNGPDPLATVLASVGEVRLLASVAPNVIGDGFPAFAGPLGVDNITALVPEPSALGFLAASAVLLVRRRR